jgi:nicotinate-nucleotide adenylyltransferase
MKIGFLGGTFDPPHIGHLALAHAALDHLGLDEVMFVPAGRNPFKPQSRTTPARTRLEMVELAIEGESRFSVTDIEVTRPGASYTVDTLEELAMARPADYWVLLGADVLTGFVAWKHPHRILQLARLGVANRPPSTRQTVEPLLPDWISERVDWIDADLPPISATEIRSMILRGKPVGRWVPPAVAGYLADHPLYRTMEAS